MGGDKRQIEDLIQERNKLALLASTTKIIRQQGRHAYNIIYIQTTTFRLANKIHSLISSYITIFHTLQK